jgi:hypothetical protein
MWLWLVRDEPAIQYTRTCGRRATNGDILGPRQELWIIERTEIGGIGTAQAKRLKFGNKQRSLLGHLAVVCVCVSCWIC